MPTNRHIIAKQIFDLAIGKSLDGYVLQERISYIYWEKVAPSLADLFDRLAGPEVLIRIDRLEIDLGEIDLSRLDSEFADRMIQVMGTRLTELLAKASNQVEQFPMAHSHFEAWLYFLEHGFLPWNSAGMPEEELHQAALETVAAESDAVAQLRQLLRSRPNAAQRLVIQHPPSFLKLLAEAISGRRQEKLALVAQELQKLSEEYASSVSVSEPDRKRPSASQASHVFWTAVVKRLAEQLEPVLSLQLVQAVAAELLKIQRSEAAAIVAELVERQPAVFPELAIMLAGLPKPPSAPPADTAVVREKEEPVEGREDAPLLPETDVEAERKEERSTTSDSEIPKPEVAGREESGEDTVPETERETPIEDGQAPEPLEGTEAEPPVSEKAKPVAEEGLPQKDKEREQERSLDRDSTAPLSKLEEQQLDQAADEQALESSIPEKEKEREPATEEGREEPSSTPEHSEQKAEGVAESPAPESPSSADAPVTEDAPEQPPAAVPEETPPAAEAEEKRTLDTPEKTAEKEQGAAADRSGGEIVEEVPSPEGEERTPSSREQGPEEIPPPTPEEQEEREGLSRSELPEGEDPVEENRIVPQEEDAKELNTTSVDKPAPAEETAEMPEGLPEAQPPEHHATEKAEPADRQDIVPAQPKAEEPTAGNKKEPPVTPPSEEAAPKEKQTTEKRKEPKKTKEHKAAAEEENRREAPRKEEPDAIHSLKKQQEELPAEDNSSQLPSEKVEKRKSKAAEPEAGATDEQEGPTTPPAKKGEQGVEASPPDEGAEEEQQLEEQQDKASGRKIKPEEDSSTEKAAKAPAPKQEADEPLGKKSKDREKASASERPERRPAKVYSKPFDKQPEGTVYYIRNAGVIMVHAFLNTYFEAIGLAKQRQFVDEISCHKAIHLIEYMATGETGLPEYGLVLPKFLCSLPLEVPLEREVGIQESDLEEADNLLRAVIKHWGAIGEASPTALREGFLRREGKLERRANGWYLVVEHKTMDVLLNRLPWNISMVQLPWMEEMLRVEWA